MITLSVVIAIIAILAAMLLPALSAARESARANNCRGNLKNQGLGVMLYAQNNDSYIPCAKMSQGNNKWYFWVTAIAEQLGETGRWSFAWAADTPQSTKVIFQCPTLISSGEANTSKTGGSVYLGLTYQYYTRAGNLNADNEPDGGITRRPRVLGSMPDPSGALLVAENDKYAHWGFDFGYSATDTFLGAPHSKTMNCLYADSHVESQRDGAYDAAADYNKVRAAFGD